MMRAATFVTAAWQSFAGWMLWGPRQHDGDLLASLGTVSFTATGERVGKP